MSKSPKKKRAKYSMKEINLKGFVIRRIDSSLLQLCAGRSIFCDNHHDFEKDLRLAKVFSTEKSAVRFIAKQVCYINQTEFRIEPISKYIVSGYREKNSKIIKVNCFKVDKEFYSVEGRKSGEYVTGPDVFKTAAECNKDAIRNVKDCIRYQKAEIKDGLQNLKKLEKELKKLNLVK